MISENNSAQPKPIQNIVANTEAQYLNLIKEDVLSSFDLAIDMKNDNVIKHYEDLFNDLTTIEESISQPEASNLTKAIYSYLKTNYPSNYMEKYKADSISEAKKSKFYF